jgi:hypothetical protein
VHLLIRDEQVRAMAQVLLKRHPQDAFSAALERCSKLAEDGDVRAASLWSRVALEIAELEAHPPAA